MKKKEGKNIFSILRVIAVEKRVAKGVEGSLHSQQEVYCEVEDPPVTNSCDPL